MVAVPASEGDIEVLVAFAARESIPITARGAGSNQSGSAVGSGIILLSDALNRINRKNGRLVGAGPGIDYEDLDSFMRKDGLRLPYDPSSRAYCTIGGNVATRASGLRSIKYGTVDSALRSLRFVDMAHGAVDTSEGLPRELEEEILKIRTLLRNDRAAVRMLEGRSGLKSSSGYNISSFFKYDDPGEIVAHLMVGSVGTLGIFTTVELEAVAVPKERELYLLFFPSLVEAAVAIVGLQSIGPSALEIMDDNGLRTLWEEQAIDFPAESRAVIMAEFDEDLARVHDLLAPMTKKALSFIIEDNPTRQVALWGVRESMLPRIISRMQTRDERFPSFADDIGVPLVQLPGFLADLQGILQKEHTYAVIYGHAGEGNMHIRPMIRLDGWQERLRRLSDEIFRSALGRGGTISAEHGMGRNRSMYLRDEWGERLFEYFRKIKSIFDPKDLLNPGIVFTDDDITKNLKVA
jgi:FAD/FMN-containing dehydrogenase